MEQSTSKSNGKEVRCGRPVLIGQRPNNFFPASSLTRIEPINVDHWRHLIYILINGLFMPMVHWFLLTIRFSWHDSYCWSRRFLITKTHVFWDKDEIDSEDCFDRWLHGLQFRSSFIVEGEQINGIFLEALWTIRVSLCLHKIRSILELSR